MSDVKRVGVLGCGLMGSGIAQVAATAGYETIARDVSKEIGERARAGIEKSLAKFVEKAKLAAPDRDAVLKRLSFTTAVADLKKVLEGSGECAEKGWVFLHLSIAGWTLVFFIAMIAASLALTRRD